MGQRLVGWCSVLMMAVLGTACATEAPMMAPSAEPSFTLADRQANVIELERVVHFQSPEGQPVAVPPGFYQVAAVDAKTLRLTPHAGGAPVMIAAVPSPQTYRLEQGEPIAIALPGEQEDTQHIVLAQVDGTALEAAGSYSGTQTRSLNVFVPFGGAQTSVQTKVFLSTIKGQATAPPNVGSTPPAFEAPLTITAGPNVSYFQACTGMTGYVSSVIKMIQMSQGPGERPSVAAHESTHPRIILTQSRAQTTPQPRPGSLTYPNTPFNRIVPNDSNRCMFGSVTVSARNLTSGQKVRLVMEVMDIAKGRFMIITDTYELPVTTPGSVTFGKVIVASIPLFNVKADQTPYVNDVIAKVAPTGTLVKMEASVNGGAPAKRECLWKPTKNGAGQGTLTCK